MTLDEESHHRAPDRESERRLTPTTSKQVAYDVVLDCFSRAPDEVPHTRALIAAGEKNPWWHGFFALVLAMLCTYGAYAIGWGVYVVLHEAPRAVAIACGVCTGLVWCVSLFEAGTLLGDRLDRTGRRDGLVHRGTDTVLACFRAMEAPDTERPRLLQEVDALYRRTEPLVLRAHRTRGTMRSSSPRRTVARQHAELVAGALRRDLCRVDAEPEKALRDLAGKLVTVCERYAEGRVSRLLAETDLADVEPVTLTRQRLRETAHMVGVIVAMFCGALAAWLGWRAAGLPEGLPSELAPVVGMVLGGLLAGGWQRMVRVAELLPGR
ncbi:hypothetical protein [Streptomyces massasporeus]|uniref:hypothetical protein n=1 Tax=Streptomyces massasporeus TaxID=67324 RepID=UPI001675DEEB|nr:hypothetical protein [Streptomyces massasporeus]GGV90794.1 hypothetical protein GCM10010228_79930 [Streptomyces massasporeus]